MEKNVEKSTEKNKKEMGPDKYLNAEISSHRQSGEVETCLKHLAHEEQEEAEETSEEEGEEQSGSAFWKTPP